MYTVKSNNNTFKIELGNDSTINGEALVWDMIQPSNEHFHIIRNNQSYMAEVVEANYTEKVFSIKVNNSIYKIEVKDKFDELLKQLGMDSAATAKINEMKAPMPGLVVDVRVTEGQSIKKGDPVVVLEAMKMENILKSPADVTIKKINVNKGQAVEKNQVLVNFA